MIREPLYIIAVISNPCRYSSRYELYRQFEKYVRDSGAQLVTVEAAYGERPHQVTDSLNENHLRLRTGHEVWHKENLINLGIAHLSKLHPDWKYVAWIDADVSFARPDWVNETIEQLQHHQLVQPWSQSFDLGPNSESFASATSFAASYLRSLRPGRTYDYWHSGYAWAARREAIDLIGGLLDFAPLGSADFYMAWALLGELEGKLYQDFQHTTDRRFHPNYVRRLLLWQKEAQRLRRNIGCVEGALFHHWHGKKKQRFYNSREQILIKTQFDPDTDLKRDAQGLWQLVDDGTMRAIGLRDEIRGYFRARNEDSIDL